MTAPTPDKAASIPAEVREAANNAIPSKYWSGYHITAHEWTVAIADAIMQDRADRASQEKRIREALEAVLRHEASNFHGPDAEKNRRASWRGVIRQVRNAIKGKS